MWVWKTKATATPATGFYTKGIELWAGGPANETGTVSTPGRRESRLGYDPGLSPSTRGAARITEGWITGTFIHQLDRLQSEGHHGPRKAWELGRNRDERSIELFEPVETFVEPTKVLREQMNLPHLRGTRIIVWPRARTHGIWSANTCSRPSSRHPSAFRRGGL